MHYYYGFISPENLEMILNLEMDEGQQSFNSVLMLLMSSPVVALECKCYSLMQNYLLMTFGLVLYIKALSVS